MPTFNLITNVPSDRVKETELTLELSKTVAMSVGKPERYVMVSVSCGKPMCYAGTGEPCAYGEIISIGAIGGSKNQKISAALADVVYKHLAVSPDRFYIKFSDVGAADFGYNGSTFG